MKRRLLRLAVAGLSVIALLTVSFAAIPPVRARGKAVAVLARSVGIAFPRPFAKRVTVEEVRLAGVEGDLYDPGDHAPPLVLVHGAAPTGKDDARLQRVAQSIAGAGRVVFVPDLGLRDERFGWADVERIVSATVALADRYPGRGVGLVGISYGGSFCLLAAEQPELAGVVSFVAVFGSFYDILGVVQGVTTGATTHEGRVVPWETVAEARRILIDAALGLVGSPFDEVIRSALERDDPTGLPPPARAVFDLLQNRDPRRTFRLAARLPAEVRELLARFSPATRIDRLEAPVYVMQSENDPATPATEALKLHEAVPNSRLIVLRSFRHVDPPDSPGDFLGSVPDIWGAWRFVSWVLAAQE